jgi:TadE-like protein
LIIDEMKFSLMVNACKIIMRLEMSKLSRKLQSIKLENAQAMVEFALVFPIVLLITYGLIEFGRMIFIYASVTSAAREGARYGSAAGNVNSNTKYYMDCDGIRDAVRKTAILMAITDSEISIWYDHGPSTGHFPSSNICPSGTSRYSQDLLMLGDRIAVHLAVPYVPLISFLGISGFTITAENSRTILAQIPIPYP